MPKHNGPHRAPYVAPTAAEIDANLRHPLPPFDPAHPANVGKTPMNPGYPGNYGSAAQGNTKGIAGVYFPGDPPQPNETRSVFETAMIDPFGRRVAYNPTQRYNNVWGNDDPTNGWPENNVKYVKDATGKWIETPRRTS